MGRVIEGKTVKRSSYYPKDVYIPTDCPFRGFCCIPVMSIARLDDRQRRAPASAVQTELLNLVSQVGSSWTASGFLLRGRHAHHSHFRLPFFECWLKKLLSVSNRAGAPWSSNDPIDGLEKPVGFFLQFF